MTHATQMMLDLLQTMTWWPTKTHYLANGVLTVVQNPQDLKLYEITIKPLGEQIETEFPLDSSDEDKGQNATGNNLPGRDAC